jgi:nitrogen-specific signal transduction histidine kinase/CheY-like chemotaxis protein
MGGRLDRERRRLSVQFDERLSPQVDSRAEDQSDAAQADKMKAMERFARSVAHDFNNVMQAVKASATLIERHAAEPAKMARFARLLAESVARGEAATNRLLTLVGRGEFHASPVDVARLLEDVRATIAAGAGARVAIVARAEEDLPFAHADAAQLRAAVLGLAVNGYEAIGGAGKITISAGAYKAPRKSGQTSDGRDWIFISLTDTGRGMDQEMIASAREPFFTTTGSAHSMGLGLSLAEAFAEQSGGALTIESAPGRGTTVTLRLPATSLPDGYDAVEADAAKRENRRGHVLLVDDENGVREAVAAELSDHGFKVRQVAGGAAALALLASGDRVDLIIADLSMPGMDGLTLIRKAIDIRKGLPAILLTGNVAENLLVRMKRSGQGAVALCRKPIGGGELAAKVWTLIESAAKS